MKVVLISGIPILPAHEGNRSRILALSRAIRDLGHDLWVVIMPSGLSVPNDREAHVAEFGADRFVEIPPENPVARFIRRFPFRLRRKLGHVLQPALVPGAERDLGALLEQEPDRREADAGGAAGDDRELALIAVVHHFVLSSGKPGSGRPCITPRCAGVGGPAVIQRSIASGSVRGQTLPSCVDSSICIGSASIWNTRHSRPFT